MAKKTKKYFTPDNIAAEPVSTRPNKTEIKREMEKLNKLGEQLAQLTAKQRKKFTLEPELEAALIFAQQLNNKSEGYRRQLQFISKILRELDDLENISQQLESMHHKNSSD